MIEDTTTDQESHVHHLEMGYPWFSEELAQLLSQRLTSHQFTQLRRELEVAQKLLLKREARALLDLQQGERMVLLGQWAKWQRSE
jgi:hypothetical protein